MKKDIRNIIKVLPLFFYFAGLAQEPSFYIRSIRSIHLNDTAGVLQPVKFKEVDVVYNKIVRIAGENITVASSGTYEVSAFANINPGVAGNSSKDSIQMELYLIKNYSRPGEVTLGTAKFGFTYGNFDVAAGLHIVPSKVQLQSGDDVSLWVKILPESSIGINKSPKYDHITKPTGMEQIAGMRIAKISE